MASKKGNGDVQQPNRERRTRKLGERGIRTAADFANYMSALMSDLDADLMTPQKANAITNAGGKLLKVVEMQLKYGKKGDTLALAAPGVVE